MPSQPDVSILIPCHNASAWLENSIASALDCGPAEVIVVDDGSTDASAAIARGFGAGVTLIQQPQSGGNVARNRLIAAARGEWLQFLDADDYLEPAKLATQFAEAGPLDGIDVLYSPVWEEIWRNGRMQQRRRMVLDPNADLFTQWLRWHLPQTGGPLWRASALRRIGGWAPDVSGCQEHELYLRALQHDLRWKYCPTPGAVYRLWSEETVCRKDPVRMIRIRTELTERMLGWLREEGRLRPEHQEASGQAFFEMARTWARHDLRGAVAYADARGSQLRLCGPAAPLSYRAAYRLLGFRGAEKLARGLR